MAQKDDAYEAKRQAYLSVKHPKEAKQSAKQSKKRRHDDEDLSDENWTPPAHVLRKLKVTPRSNPRAGAADVKANADAKVEVVVRVQVPMAAPAVPMESKKNGRAFELKRAGAGGAEQKLPSPEKVLPPMFLALPPPAAASSSSSSSKMDKLIGQAMYDLTSDDGVVPMTDDQKREAFLLWNTEDTLDGWDGPELFQQFRKRV